MPDFVSNGGILGIREQIGERWSPSTGPRLTAHLHVSFPPRFVRPLSIFLYKIDKAGEKIEDIVSTPETYFQNIKGAALDIELHRTGKPHC